MKQQRKPAGRATSREAQRRALAAKRKKRIRRRNALISSLVLLLVLGIGVVLSLTIFFQIESVRVEGESRYSDKKIIAVSGIKAQQNMFLSNTKQAGREIEKKLPYIGQARIKRVLPGEIVIQVEDTTEAFAVKQDSGYVLTDQSGKVLNLFTEKLPKNVTEVKGVSLKQAKLGEPIAFAAEDTIERMGEIRSAMEKQGLTDITAVIVSKNHLEYTLVYQDRIELLLGSLTDLDYKIKFAKYTLEDLEQTQPGVKGQIDLTNPSKAYFNRAS